MPSELTSKVCTACEGGTQPFTPAQVDEYLGKLTASWDVVDGKKIRRTFQFADFKQAMEFVNKVAGLADQEGHHPDIQIVYSQVRLELWTHAIGGLSENDFILAAKIETL